MGNTMLAAHSTVRAIEVLVPTKPGHCCETKCFKECYFVLQLKSSIIKALKHVYKASWNLNITVLNTLAHIIHLHLLKNCTDTYNIIILNVS